MNPSTTSTSFQTACCLAGLLLPLSLHAAILPVSSATASSNWPGLSLTNTINGTGMSGTATSEAYLGLLTHDDNGGAATMWHSQLVDAAGITLTWDFTAASSLRTIYYWPHNQAGLTDRGIQTAEIQYSTNNGGNYQSLGNFNFQQSPGGALRPFALDLGSTLTGVTNLRWVLVSDFGGNVTGLSEIRFSDIAPVQPAPVLSLSSSTALIKDSDLASVDLTWVTERVSNMSITPGIGSIVDASGTDSVSPPADGDTIYTLAGDSSIGPVSQSVRIRSVTGGSSTFKFVRFTPRKLRNNSTANSIQLAEFHLAMEGTPISGGTYTNPGGSNPAGQEPQFAGDNDAATKWLDFNKSALQIEFTDPVTFDSYNFTTAGDATERDPLRWIIEGSNDGSTWTLIENFTDLDYPMPLVRGFPTADLPLPGSSLRPTLSAIADTKVIAGQPLSLHWATEGATTVTLNSGSGPVALPTTSGRTSLTPAANTTYTIIATNSFGKTTTRSFTATLINPAITGIDYDNFDAAGEEFALWGDALITADASLPVPGPGKRLRITPNEGGKIGSAWFRKRQQVAAGFDTSFSFQFKSTGNGGADGMAFVVQDHPDGSAVHPLDLSEFGLAQSALNISLDSYQNLGEPGAATLTIRTGATAVHTVNLATTPGITLPGTFTGDLTDNSANGAAHLVRVAYLPGNLSVYFDGVKVASHVPVELGSIGAMNGQGTSYVGFTGRTGGLFESHDVTDWSFTEGPPVVLLSSTVNHATGQAALTWTSAPGRSYRIVASTDLASWSTVLASGIPGAAAATSTLHSVSFPTTGARLFFRVEDE